MWYLAKSFAQSDLILRTEEIPKSLQTSEQANITQIILFALYAKTVIFFFASLLPYKMHTRQQDIDLAGVPSSTRPKEPSFYGYSSRTFDRGVPLSFTNCLFYHENASYIQTKQPGEKVTKLSSLSIKSFSCVRVHLSSNNQSGIMQLIQFLRNYEAIKLLLTNSTFS